MNVRPLDPEEREHFDQLLEQVLDTLPQHIHKHIEEVPLIVEDHPGDDVVEMFDLRDPDELCGLHDGIPLTERSVSGGDVSLPDHIMIYRRGIIATAASAGLDRYGYVDDDELRRQIRITVLHEIGHHFGLDEDELARLGYG